MRRARRLFAAAGGSGSPPGVARLGLAAGKRAELEALARGQGPAEALEHLVGQGLVERDAGQVACAASLQTSWHRLQSFADELAAWRPRNAAWLADFRAKLRARRAEEARRAEAARGKAGGSEASGEQRREAGAAPPQSHRARLEELAVGRPPRPRLGTQGLYVWGDVGRGKSLLMDIFSVSLEGSAGTPRVVRQHHHDFMRALHERIHAHRQRGSARAAVKLAAGELAGASPAVLCLDELQVTNISDAVVLRALFEALFARDIFIVMTSNRPPEDLYKDGLNHMIYMPPFLRLLNEKVSTHRLDTPTDYRERKAEADAAAALGGNAAQHVPDYFVAPASEADLHEAYEREAGCSPRAAASAELAVAWGRRVPCAAVSDGVALFGFEELCSRPLSADDYMALVQRNSVHTVALDGVPRFTVEQHNEARRFMNLVDCLYENQCRLLCTAAAEPDELMAEVEILSRVPIATQQPAMGIAGAEAPVRVKHGDVSFEVSDRNPCRPDTFASAEADAETGTHGGGLAAAIRAAKQHAAGRHAPDPTEQDGVAGVMSAALVSLQESGFAARRCASRLREMRTAEYRQGHRAKWEL